MTIIYRNINGNYQKYVNHGSNLIINFGDNAPSSLTVLINDQEIDNYNYTEIVEEYLSMKKPNKIILSHIINKITIDQDKNIDIYYKIKPVFDFDLGN